MGHYTRVHNTYVDAHLLRGRNRFKAKRYQESLKDYEAALEYPENLGMGKPHHGGRSPQVYYSIGTVHDALGNIGKAREFYEKSIAVRHAWSSVDPVFNWAEVCYYQGLAFRKLGQEEKATQIFDGLTKFGKEKLEAGPKLDFFAKFGVQESKQVALVHAHYVLGLGYLGKGKQAESMMAFEKVLKLNSYHIGAKTQLFELNEIQPLESVL